MSQATHSDDSAVLDFLLLIAEDRAAGGIRPLENYTARFPGREAAIEAAFRRRTGSADESRERGPRRIGPYELLGELGRGGQGAVYLARDSRGSREVALKVLDSFAAWRSKERVERLRREAAVVAKLEHPSICTVLDANLESDPPYLAMRVVEGCTLAQCLAASRTDSVAPAALACPPKSRGELAELLALFEHVARALHAAHEAGVVHRDVKPGNIMVKPTNEPVLLDFGLARESDSTHETLTHSGQLFGTPSYMAPERIKSSGAPVDRRCDVYSLGVTLFECLTLARPFEGADPEALFRSIAHDEVPDARRMNPVVPHELQVVLATAMEKDRERRYATALDFAEDLRRLRDDEPIRARPASSPRKLLRWSRRNPALAIGGALVFSFLAVGLAVSQHLLGQREAARRRLEGLSLGTMSLNLVDDDPTRSLLLAVESAAIEREYYGDTALFAALAGCREAKQFNVAGVVARDVDFAPDSSTLAMCSDDPRIEIGDLSSGAMLATLDAHTAAVLSVRYSADGRTLASASADGTARLWDTREWRARTVLAGHAKAVRHAEFSPDDSLVVTASNDGTARLWKVSNTVCERVFTGHDGVVTRASFDASGSRLLTLSGAPMFSPEGSADSSDFTARVWEVATGAAVAVLRGHAAMLTDGAFDASGERVVTCSADGTVRVWSARDGAELARFDHGSAVRCVAWCGAELVVAGDEHGLRAWNLRDASFTDWKGHLDRPINSLAVSPDGSRVVSGSSDVTARVWDAATGRELATLRRADGRITACRWSRDGRWIATTTWGQRVHVWFADEPSGVSVLRSEGAPVVDLAFDSSGSRVAACSEGGRVSCWRSGERQWSLVREVELSARPVSIAFDPSGSRAIVADRSGSAHVVSVASRGPDRILAGHTAPLRGASFSQSDESALTWSDDGTVRTWDEHGAARLVLRAQDGAVTSAAISPRGDRIAAAGTDRTIAVFDARDGRPLERLGPFGVDDPTSSVVAFVAFSRDGARLAASGLDASTRVIDLASGRVVTMTLSAVTGRAMFSADGSRLFVSTRWNPLAYLFDAASGERLLACGDRNFGAHTSTFSACELSSDGATILTASNDRSVRLWHASDGSRRARLPDHAAAVTDACFSPDATRFATADASGAIRVWPVDPLPSALARRPRELGPREREHYRDL